MTNTKLNFLIDTGAALSVLPAGRSDRFKKGNATLRAANDSIINNYGSRQLILDFGLPRPLTWRFLAADVAQPIIGADLLLQHKLLVDLDSRRLIDTRNEHMSKQNLHHAPFLTFIFSLCHHPPVILSHDFWMTSRH